MGIRDRKDNTKVGTEVSNVNLKFSYFSNKNGNGIKTHRLIYSLTHENIHKVKTIIVLYNY